MDLTNNLVDDGTLSRRVAEALALDARTRDIPPGYEVTAVFGRILLVGFFTDAQSRELLTVAQGVPGVREVSVKTLA
jgi:hypothetical protein